MIDASLRELIACPVCRGPLVSRDDPPSLHCSACAATYPVRSGIPILRPADRAVPSADPEASREHKRKQVTYFDQDPGDDFGVVRPRGAPALYEALLRDKFRRSVIGLQTLLPGSTALVVCGGSGLDAEFLVRAGARVILSDISLGVVLQAQERSRRFGLDLLLVVADVEALPFRDSTIDLVYVHDGLHHLEDPAAGLAEMARVARRAVSVNEPAASALTRAATRVGWAEDEEEAGNPVARLRLETIVRELEARGFRPIRPHRYTMLYRHWPGRTMRALSLPLLLPLSVAALKLANFLLGRYGNKLAVQALRSGE